MKHYDLTSYFVSALLAALLPILGGLFLLDLIFPKREWKSRASEKSSTSWDDTTDTTKELTQSKLRVSHPCSRG